MAGWIAITQYSLSPLLYEWLTGTMRVNYQRHKTRTLSTLRLFEIGPFFWISFPNSDDRELNVLFIECIFSVNIYIFLKSGGSNFQIINFTKFEQVVLFVFLVFNFRQKIMDFRVRKNKLGVEQKFIFRVIAQK